MYCKVENCKYNIGGTCGTDTEIDETGECEYIEPKDEPRTCEDCKHNGEKHAYDYACDKCTDMDKFQHEDEPQTDCSWK